ncbi:MAG: hydrogenase formation protein HypD, partial [Acidobacteria bacterium]|nr:hydrogenase formation protein HypD [Acidobacteriota bacterium]
GIPIVVTGFEPVDILQGIYMTVSQLEQGRAVVENQYARSVRLEGNVPARELLAEVFETTDRKWRGIGEIPNSGFQLRERYSGYDAERLFDVSGISAQESPLCIAGMVLQGLKRPHECSAFGSGCTPEHPLGAPMVSSEGACAAYFHYGRIEVRGQRLEVRG